MGRILDKLVELGLDSNTLVSWTSDNGSPMARRPGDPYRGSNGPLFGRGYTTAEGAFRVPMLVWWPGKIPSGTECSELSTTMDLLPTFARLAGVLPPSDMKIDGHDIRALLFEETCSKTPYEALYYYNRDQLQAIRSGPWKLFLPLTRAIRHPHYPGSHNGPTEALLFNVVDDVSCSNNLASVHPEIVDRLEALASQAREELGDFERPGKGQRARGRVEHPSPRVLEQ